MACRDREGGVGLVLSCNGRVVREKERGGDDDVNDVGSYEWM